MNNERRYTIALLLFATNNDKIVGRIVMHDLESMTLKEAHTMISKQQNPVEWMPVDLSEVE